MSKITASEIPVDMGNPVRFQYTKSVEEAINELDQRIEHVERKLAELSENKADKPRPGFDSITYYF